jgi:hypothetical protein
MGKESSPSSVMQPEDAWVDGLSGEEVRLAIFQRADP